MTSVETRKLHFAPTMVLQTERFHIPNAKKVVKLKRLREVNLRDTNRRIRELIKVILIATA